MLSGPLSILSKIRLRYEPAHLRRVVWPLACCPYWKAWGIGHSRGIIQVQPLSEPLLCTQEKAKLSLPFHRAQFGFSKAAAPLPAPVPASTVLLGRTSSDSLQTTQYLGPSCSPMDGLTLPHPALPGIPLQQSRHTLLICS